MPGVHANFRFAALFLLLVLVLGSSQAQEVGDLDANGRIDHRDLFLLGLHWHNPVGDFPRAALSGGERVHAADLLALRSRFRHVYDTTLTYNMADYAQIQLDNRWNWRSNDPAAPAFSEVARAGAALRDRDGRLRYTINLQLGYMGIERHFAFRGPTLALFQVSFQSPDGLSLKDVRLTPEIDFGHDRMRVGDVFQTRSQALIPVPKPIGPPGQEIVDVDFILTCLAAGEPVVVPAGRFLDTLKFSVEASATFQGETVDLSTLSGMFWFARGAGEVKRVLSDGTEMALESALVNGIAIP